MTRLVNCRVQGLAGQQRDVDLEFGGLNVLFGRNGSGKTSLLRLLHSACRNNAGLVSDVPFVHAEVEVYSEDLERSFTRSLEQQPRSSSDSFENTDAIDALYFGKGQRQRWDSSEDGIDAMVCTYLATQRVEVPPRAWVGDMNRRTTIEGLFVDRLQEVWRQYAAEMNLDVREIQERGLAEMLRGVFDDSEVDSSVAATVSPSAYERANEYMKRRNTPLLLTKKKFESNYLKNPIIRGVVDKIDEIEEQLESTERPRDRLQALVSELVGERVTVDFSETGISVRDRSDDKIPLSALSSGQHQLLMILVETMAAHGSTIIIDEPELSMHVDWQQRLLGAMRTVNPDCQIVVATHSPEIMADVADSDILPL